MARSLFPSAPELSRIVSAAPIDLLEKLAGWRDFRDFIPGDFALEPETEAAERQATLRTMLSNLAADRLKLVEAEAARISAMSEEIPDEFLRRIQGSSQFDRYAELSRRQGALERSLWAFLDANDLFVAAERAVQVRLYRDHAKFYEAWQTEQPVAASAGEIDVPSLETEISERLQFEEGCVVEAIDLPAEDGGRKQVLLAVIAAGPYASQLTVAPDRQTRRITFRPANELLLVYTPALGKMEVCARDPVDRRTLARAFAEAALEEDLSSKPLSQRVYDLSRFRQSLELDIPESQASHVQRVSITKVEFRLASWTQRLTLQVGVEEDIEQVARHLFGDMASRLGSRIITSVEFCVIFHDAKGRKATLRFTVSGRNRSSILSQTDARKRALGYDLLEHWGVARNLRDLKDAERPTLTGDFLALYDVPTTDIGGDELDQMGISVDRLVAAGVLHRTGWDDVVLFDDDVTGPVTLSVAPEGQVGDQGSLNLEGGADGPRIDMSSLSRFRINHPYVREEIRTMLAPLELRGRVRELDPSLHHLGEATIRSQNVPVYLARGLSDDAILERVDRLVRSDPALTKGIVLVPTTPRLPCLGAHVVLGTDTFLDARTGTVDRQALEIAYLSGRTSAGAGDAVIFTKSGAGAAQLTVPGQTPLIIVGEKRVRVIESLHKAHLKGEPAVSTGELQRKAGISQLSQSYGKTEWAFLQGRYVRKVDRGLWALNA